MAYTLIETASGERMLVLSVGGHGGATVVAKAVPEQPSPFHRLTADGKWMIDSAAVEADRLRRMTREQLIEEAVRRVQAVSPGKA